MAKTELLNALAHILTNSIYGLVITRLVPDERWNTINPAIVTFKGPQGDLINVDIAPLCKSMVHPASKKIITEEFEICLKRASVREGHEVILLYCEESNQFQLYKSQPWFQFARIIRNVVSHKQAGILREWPNDLLRKGITQVTWRSRILDTTMVGLDVEFTMQEALQLLDDQIKFVQNTLA